MSVNRALSRFSLVLLSVVSAFGVQRNSYAQTELEGPPEIHFIDEAGVDINSGYSVIGLDDLSIGSGKSFLNHRIATFQNIFGDTDVPFWDNYMVSMVRTPGPGGSTYHSVSFGHTSKLFVDSVSGFVPVMDDGSTLEQAPDLTWTLTTRDGSKVTFKETAGYPTGNYTFEYPNGYTITVHTYDPGPGYRDRIQSVTTNTGLQLKYEYARNASPTTSTQSYDFYHPTRITATNNATEYCNPSAHTCGVGSSWPEVSYSWPTYNQFNGDPAIPSDHGDVETDFIVTDSGGRTTKYTHELFTQNVSGGAPYDRRVTKIVQNTSSGPVTSTYDYDHYIYCGNPCSILRSNVVSQATRGGATWTYSYSTNVVGTVTYGNNYSYGPVGNLQLSWLSYSVPNSKRNVPLTLTHFNGNSLSFDQSELHRVDSADYRSGNSASFQYDSRRNLTQRTDDAGTSDPADDSVTQAHYDACTATNFRWCNKPRWTRDAYGKQTDYEYYDAHGGIKRITLPAPSTGQPRPEIRYTYQQSYAWYKNSSGQIVQASSPIWLLSEESECVQGAASGNGCANPNYEVLTEYDYGTGSSTRANNLWLIGKTVTARTDNFTSLQVHRTCFQYDDVGNVVAETLPAANLSSCD